MKKFSFFMISMALILCLSGCASKSSTAGTTAATTKAATTATTIAESTVLKPEKFENNQFSVIAPAGWKKNDVEGGFRLYKRYPSMSGEFYEITITGSNLAADFAKKQIEALAKKNEGTEAAEVDFLGKRFWTSSYKETGVPQVSYLCIEKGVLITVKYGGPLFESNPVFKEITDTVKFK